MSYSKSKRSIRRRRLLIAFIAFFLGCMYVIWQSLHQQGNVPAIQVPIAIKNEKPAQVEQPHSLPDSFEAPQGSIFVPYWKVGSLTEPLLPDFMQYANIQNIIYFGVTPLAGGAFDQSEPGYKDINTFVSRTRGVDGRKLLAIRMMNEDTNEAILSSESYQEKLVTESLALAVQYDFDGFLIDFEHSVLATKDTVEAISTFLELYALKSREADLYFAVALYGDTFYRGRPYDVQKIASFSDEIMIMAYDFHKSYGEPGPNFPLFKGEEYGYDFATMIADFAKVVPTEKITVLFGLFGYDWSVDDQNRPAKAAAPLSLSNIEAKIARTCAQHDCTLSRSSTAHESTIRYADGTGQKHTVWFEDSASIKAKTSFLSTKNIRSVGYWAYGYY